MSRPTAVVSTDNFAASAAPETHAGTRLGASSEDAHERTQNSNLATEPGAIDRSTASNTLTVVTYNMAMGLLNVRLERALQRRWFLRPLGRWLPTLQDQFIRRADLRDVDVLGLQEVCLGDSAQLTYFAAILRQPGLEPYVHSAPEGPSSDACNKGQALISRYRITDTGVLRLPRVGANRVAIWVDLAIAADAKPHHLDCEPRPNAEMSAALSAAVPAHVHHPTLRGPLASALPHSGLTTNVTLFRSNTQRIRVYNLHLSNRDGRNLRPIAGRVQQVRAVLDHALELEASTPGTPIVILGDFNSLGDLVRPWREESAIALVRESGFVPVIEPFRPTMLLPYKTDWIFYRNLALRTARIPRIVYSDHFPVVAVFDLPSQPGGTDTSPPPASPSRASP